MKTTQQLARAIAHQQQLIKDTAEQAEGIERYAEALPAGGEKGMARLTALRLRDKARELIIELHALEARLPEPDGIKVVTLECLINRCNGNDTGLFAHEQTPRVPEEMGHHWEGFTKAINQAAA